MAVTAETRTHLIGLSVVMLGSAPGTDLLNEWVAAYEDGMSLDDIANHIAASDAFLAKYPAFLTNGEFAESFLDDLMGSESVPAAIVAAAGDIVAALLNDGMSRGSLALNVVAAMADISGRGEDHPAYGDLGMVAMALSNKIAVAEYYTVDLRQASSNSRVLREIDSDTGLADIMGSIGDYLDPAAPILLTNLRDNIEGTVGNDLIIAEPDPNGNDTLDSFDVIDGGAGYDTLEVYVSDTALGHVLESINGNHADVTNVEKAYLSSRTAINVDLSGWEGLQEVVLGRFGGASDVSVTVDGATVNTGRTFGGKVTIAGAGGAVDLMAGKTSAVTVSGKHATSVMVDGGMRVTANGDAIASVSVDGVQRDNGADNMPGSSDGEMVTVSATNGNLTPSATVTQYGTPNTAGTDFEAIPNGAANPTTTYYLAATQPSYLAVGEVVVTTVQADAKGYIANSADSASVMVTSKMIGSVSIANTEAIVEVTNGADAAMDLSVMADKFAMGELHLDGKGAAANVMIDVAGDSSFDLTSGAKAVSVSGAGKLTLGLAGSAGTVESVTLGGAGAVTIDAMGLGKLKAVDASGSSGANSISNVGASVTSVTGGSGSDTVSVTAYAGDGLAANLGAGDDTFSSGAGNAKSAIDGGDGRDTLKLTADGMLNADKKSIYSNFEVLDIGGSATATYNVALLGVDTVKVSKDTAAGATATLSGMADGMGIDATAATARIVHDMKDRTAGDKRYSGELDVSLMAKGGETDAKGGPGTGVATLTLQADAEIEYLNVDSSATPGGKAAAGDYTNVLTLDLADGNTAASIEVIRVTGNAQLDLRGDTTNNDNNPLSLVKVLDAAGNSGGVTFTAVGNAAVDLIGGSGDDKLTGADGKDVIMGGAGKDVLKGGNNDDTITGGAGMDTLDGGDGTNVFKYGSVSESSMSAYDTIDNWGGGTNFISLGKAIFGGLYRSNSPLREVTGDGAINSRDGADSTTNDSLKDWIGDGNGVFEKSTGTGLNVTTTQHAITTVTELYWEDTNGNGTYENGTDTDLSRTWILIDVDADGDFDAATDIVIALTGTLDLTDSGDQFTA